MGGGSEPPEFTSEDKREFCEVTLSEDELRGLEVLKEAEVFLLGNGGTRGEPGVTTVDDLFTALGDLRGSSSGSGDFRNSSKAVFR